MRSITVVRSFFSWYSFDKIKAEKFFGFYFVYLMLVDFVV
ncbi:hypothetical protein EZBTHKR_0028 [Elizabethkingia anophelis]|nr:hypothetical protein EZBTHKR_0028 [Elizabethkingia anophelis]